MKEKFKAIAKAAPPMIGYSTANILIGGGPYIIGLYFMMFLTEVEGLSFSQASLVVLIAKVWDAVIDPFLGLVSDRTRTRFGRRRPYFLLGILPVALSYFCMWNSFGIPNNQGTAKMIYFMFAYVAFTTACSLVSVPQSSLLPEAAPEYSLRVHYNSVGYMFNSVGMESAFLLTISLFGFTNTELFTPELKPKFMMMGALLGVFFALPLIITFFSTKEKDWRGVPKPELNLREVIWEYKTTFKSRAYRQYIVLPLVQYLCVNIWSSSMPFFLRYVAQLPEKLQLINTLAGVGQMSGFPLNYWLSLRYGKQTPAKLLTPLMLVALLVSFFVRPVTYGANMNTTYIMMTISVMLFYFGFSGMGMTPSTIFPDTSDVDELITGRRREGVLSAVNTFTAQVAVGVGQAIFGWVSDAFGVKTGIGPENEVPVQTDAAIWGLRVTFAILPAILVVASIILSRRFKMNKNDHVLIVRVIAEKKAQGTVTITAEEKATLENLAGQRFEDMWIGQAA
ncbi:MAG: MFS transporter [Oscillospiraceae bacterium]|jgi:oligogalacturonide transporter|nr:MFS transporter [Oscillospiraceae bacterium]